MEPHAVSKMGSRARKRLERMRANPRDWDIKDVMSLCEAFGMHCSAPKRGGHYKISHPDLPEILTVPAHRPVKPVYVKALVSLIDRILGETADAEEGP